MPYTNGYEQDVLICFADEDDASLQPTDPGWVSYMGHLLTKFLGTHGLGGSVLVRTILPGNLPKADRLHSLDRSAALVVVASPAFAQSPWLLDSETKARLLHFATQAPERVFLVIKSRVEENSVPEPLWGLKHRVFWQLQEGVPFTLGLVAPGDDQSFIARVNDLAYGVAAQLQRLSAPVQAAPQPPTKATLFLAEVTPDLEDRRAEIERCLGQQGIDVLPTCHLPADSVELDRLLTTDLASSSVFVQLLSNNIDNAAPDGQPQRQLAAALARGMRVLQWRDPGLNVDTVAPTDLSELLRRPTVHAESISDFQHAITEALKPAPILTAPGDGPFVFVDARPEDDPHLRAIFGQVQNKARWDWHDAQPLKRLKNVCDVFDAVLVFWGGGESDHSQERYYQFLKYWRAKKKRETLVRIFDGPPPMKPQLQGAGLPVIRCRDGSHVELIEFLDRCLLPAH